MDNEPTETGNHIPVTMTDENGNPMYPKASLRNVRGVLPVSKGGSGINELTGGKLIASSEDGDFMEEIDVDVKTLFDKLRSNRTYNVNVVSSNWVNTSDGYENEIVVNGITGEDNPIVSLIGNTDSANYNLILEAYSNVDKVVTSDNKIVLVAYDSVPTKDFSIKLICVGA